MVYFLAELEKLIAREAEPVDGERGVGMVFEVPEGERGGEEFADEDVEDALGLVLLELLERSEAVAVGRIHI